MSDFNTAFQLTSKAEGGYSLDPNDNGGESYRGVARNFESAWKGWVLIDKHKKEKDFPQNLSNDANLNQLVITFYKTEYWNALNLSDIESQKMANELYDSAVNIGAVTAGLYFQRVLNALNKGTVDLKLDGQIGHKTIGLFNSLSDSDKYIAWKLFNSLQGAHYINICEYNISQRKFIRGWAGRVFEI